LREVFAVFGLVVQVLVVPRVRLYVHAVGAVIKRHDVAICLVARALQPETLAMVDEDLVVSTADSETLTVGAELYVLQTVARVSVFVPGPVEITSDDRAEARKERLLCTDLPSKMGLSVSALSSSQAPSFF
jgi:hypothetical protein